MTVKQLKEKLAEYPDDAEVWLDIETLDAEYEVNLDRLEIGTYTNLSLGWVMHLHSLDDTPEEFQILWLKGK